MSKMEEFKALANKAILTEKECSLVTTIYIRVMRKKLNLPRRILKDRDLYGLVFWLVGFQSVQYWKAGGKATLATYRHACIYNGIINFSKKTHKNIVQNASDISKVDIVDKHKEVVPIFDIIKPYLTNEEFEFISYYFHGGTLDAYAEKVGTGKGNVYWQKKKILNYLREVLKDKV